MSDSSSGGSGTPRDRDRRDGDKRGDRAQGPARDGQRGGAARSASGGKPWEKKRDGAGSDRAGRGGASGGAGRRGGSPSGGEKRLWTREGRPARGDRDARETERALTEEEKLARELRSVRPRHEAPEIPEDVTARDLDKVARNELKTLSKENAEEVARHLVMAARLIEDDPSLAHQHALSAERRAGRIAIVRETLAITAYAIGDFALAIRELRTYRRISGSNNELPLMVDSERGVGRPARALEVGRSVDRGTLPVDVQVSLAIAMSGARLDLEQPEAALTELEIPQLTPDRAFSYSPDLFYAYAEVLDELGRRDEAATWRDRAERAEIALGEADGADHGETIDVVEEEYEAHGSESMTSEPVILHSVTTDDAGSRAAQTGESDAAAAQED